jgi:FkbM family methyltransferase
MRRMNIARDSAAALMRRIPCVAGHGRLSETLSKGFLRLGADPIAVCRMKLGHRLILDTRVQSHVWAHYSGHYDDEKIRFLFSFMRSGGTAIDVGANIGFYAVPLGMRARSLGSRVIAFEPVPSNSQRLVENIALNGLAGTVEIVRAGLSNKARTASITLREDFQAGGDVGNAALVIDDGKDSEFPTLSIALMRLDDIWQELGSPRLDVVKVDIEGHEDLFLEGARQTIARFLPLIQVEVNPWFLERRGVDFDRYLKNTLPAEYAAFKLTGGPQRIGHLADIRGIEDVFMLPRHGLPQIAQIRAAHPRPS